MVTKNLQNCGKSTGWIILQKVYHGTQYGLPSWELLHWGDVYNLVLKKVWQKQGKQLLLLGGCSQHSPGVVGHTKWILCVSVSVSLPVYGASKSAGLIWTIIRIIHNNFKREWFVSWWRKEKMYFLKWLFKVTVEAVEEYHLALGINMYSMTQRPGLEIKTEVTTHMLCLCYKQSSLPCLKEL